MTAPHQPITGDEANGRPVTIFGPDFPFAYDQWLLHPAGLGRIPAERHGTEVAVIGAGMAGITAAYELMKLGLKPVVYESRRLGGRLHSEPFKAADGVVAELGGMRFPRSSTAFYHYLDLFDLETRPFANPLATATPSTVIDLEGTSLYAETADDLPPLLRDVGDAWREALEDEASFSEMQSAIRVRDVGKIKQIWNDLVPKFDDVSFYGFIAKSEAFARRSFRHLEVFGQVGFGTGGWDTDFPNSMLEILRVVFTDCDEDQHFVVGGVEQVPRNLWNRRCDAHVAHWPKGTSLCDLHSGAPRPGVSFLERRADGRIGVTDFWGDHRSFDTVLVACQSWLLTTSIQCDESLFSQKIWMALDRTRYMQSSKTFVMVDRPFWKDIDPSTGRPKMSMTLTDRNTRGTYLIDNGDNEPGVIVLSYAWQSDAMKVLAMDAGERAELAIQTLEAIYPNTDLRSHIIGEPITVSWEADPHFLGAFKGALPGHYRYNRRMHSHFLQSDFPAEQQGIFLAGDDVSWTPGWAEGAVHTALNAVWGICHRFGGKSPSDNPGPGDVYAAVGPIMLPDP